MAGKPDEDVEAHLWTNDWMDTHALSEGVKVQRFCLILIGEARLWYESHRPIALDWNSLQINLDNNIQRLEILENNYFMHRDHSTVMRIQKLKMLMSCILGK